MLEPIKCERNTEKPPANPFFKPSVPDGPTITIELPRDNRAEIRLRSKLTPDECKRFFKVLQAMAFGFVDGDMPDDALTGHPIPTEDDQQCSP